MDLRLFHPSSYGNALCPAYHVSDVWTTKPLVKATKLYCKDMSAPRRSAYVCAMIKCACSTAAVVLLLLLSFQSQTFPLVKGQLLDWLEISCTMRHLQDVEAGWDREAALLALLQQTADEAIDTRAELHEVQVLQEAAAHKVRCNFCFDIDSGFLPPS